MFLMCTIVSLQWKYSVSSMTRDKLSTTIPFNFHTFPPPYCNDTDNFSHIHRHEVYPVRPCKCAAAATPRSANSWKAELAVSRALTFLGGKTTKFNLRRAR
jgi:hypothetical protein